MLYNQHLYPTHFTNVHGERPSSEYAKLRKELLESEFGQALGTYSSKSFSRVYRFGPFSALYRGVIISFHVLKLTIWQFFYQDTKIVLSSFGKLSSAWDLFTPRQVFF